ncbi:MAG: DUF5671 domain-containing protein [Candidatus Kerfeldbacteria bacterium]
MGTIGMFMGFLSPVAIIGIILFFIMAIVAESKAAGKGGAVRSAFSYAVSLVMLLIIVAASAFLLQEGLRAWVFTKAESSAVSGIPPVLTLSVEKTAEGPGAAYACTDSCQFNAVDKGTLSAWKNDYASWRDNNTTTGAFTTYQKRTIVNAFSFLIVAIPLFWWFFIRMVQREQRKARAEGMVKSGPLRSCYFYLVAFTGLVGVVVSGALLINLGLKNVMGLQKGSSTSSPAMVDVAYEQNGVKSVINCTDKCAFTVEDKALAEQWLVDYDAYRKTTMGGGSNSAQTDLSTLIPIILVTAPLFLYHFITIRRETAEETPKAPANPTASV